MEKPVAGTIVAIKFPFSDLSSTKLRPALVLGNAEFDNLIVCQITSKPYSSKIAIRLLPRDTAGILEESYIRPDKIFTADPSLIEKVVVKIGVEKQTEVKNTLRQVLGL